MTFFREKAPFYIGRFDLPLGTQEPERVMMPIIRLLTERNDKDTELHKNRRFYCQGITIENAFRMHMHKDLAGPGMFRKKSGLNKLVCVKFRRMLLVKCHFSWNYEVKKFVMKMKSCTACTFMRVSEGCGALGKALTFDFCAVHCL